MNYSHKRKIFKCFFLSLSSCFLSLLSFSLFFLNFLDIYIREHLEIFVQLNNDSLRTFILIFLSLIAYT